MQAACEGCKKKKQPTNSNDIVKEMIREVPMLNTRYALAAIEDAESGSGSCAPSKLSAYLA